jgi:predicted DsbA family dithiol-disulfide isomerase
MEKKTLLIEIVSDVVCPWCMVGKKRLEKAIKNSKDILDQVSIEIRWKPFFLNPDASEVGVNKL